MLLSRVFCGFMRLFLKLLSSIKNLKSIEISSRTVISLCGQLSRLKAENYVFHLISNSKWTIHQKHCETSSIISSLTATRQSVSSSAKKTLIRKWKISHSVMAFGMDLVRRLGWWQLKIREGLLVNSLKIIEINKFLTILNFIWIQAVTPLSPNPTHNTKLLLHPDKMFFSLE